MRRVTIFAICAVIAGSSSAVAQAITTCEAASPHDLLPDEVALQACLDHYDWVLLKADDGPRYVGYLVADTIKIKKTGALLTTSDNPRKAIIRAAPGLSSSMLRALGVNGFEISFIRFDGNRENRPLARDRPCDELRNYRNVELMGVGFRVRIVESFRAICGSGMTIGGSQNFEVSRSMFYDNGRQPEDANGISGLWADGLTVFDCRGATIRDNEFWDNTDVDLGVNGGAGCSVYRNRIRHTEKYAFAGLVIGDPSRTGGEFSENSITSARDMLGVGMMVGCHPFSQCGGDYASNVAVYNNSVSGAVVNLVVDGLDGGSVRNNSLSGAQGVRVMNCPGQSADYVVGHVRNQPALQAGYVVRFFDFGSTCQP